jgi:hypothetical protein
MLMNRSSTGSVISQTVGTYHFFVVRNVSFFIVWNVPCESFLTRGGRTLTIHLYLVSAGSVYKKADRPHTLEQKSRLRTTQPRTFRTLRVHTVFYPHKPVLISSISSKRTSKFSMTRFGLLLFGMTEIPRHMEWQSISCAAVFLYCFANLRIYVIREYGYSNEI